MVQVFELGEGFSFEKVEDEGLKLKFAPIQLQWPTHGRSRSADALEGRTRTSNLKPIDVGKIQTFRWFRLPPKVRIVPGVLGSYPADGTHVGNLSGGEGKVSGDSESEQPKPISADLDRVNQVALVQIPPSPIRHPTFHKP